MGQAEGTVYESISWKLNGTRENIEQIWAWWKQKAYKFSSLQTFPLKIWNSIIYDKYLQSPCVVKLYTSEKHRIIALFLQF